MLRHAIAVTLWAVLIVSAVGFLVQDVSGAAATRDSLNIGGLDQEVLLGEHVTDALVLQHEESHPHSVPSSEDLPPKFPQQDPIAGVGNKTIYQIIEGSTK